MTEADPWWLEAARLHRGAKVLFVPLGMCPVWVRQRDAGGWFPYTESCFWSELYFTVCTLSLLGAD